jgi:integrase
VKNRLGEFARGHVSDRGVSPNHGWRHRFRTVGTEVGIPGNVIDALCGWSAKSVGERYGSVSLKARADAIARLPWVAV